MRKATGMWPTFALRGNADEFRICAVADTQARANSIAKMGVAEPHGFLRLLKICHFLRRRRSPTCLPRWRVDSPECPRQRALEGLPSMQTCGQLLPVLQCTSPLANCHEQF